MGCSKRPFDEGKREILSFNIREGERLFKHYCAPCHGETADGSGRYFPSHINPQATDFINSGYLNETNKDVMFRAIKYGSAVLGKSNFSPPYGGTLRDEEIEYIMEYLHFVKESREEERTDKHVD